jgi:hypothetical protein
MASRDFEIEVTERHGGKVEIIGQTPGGAKARAELDFTSLLALGRAPQERWGRMPALAAGARDFAPLPASNEPALSAEDLGDELFRALFFGQLFTLLREARSEAEAHGEMLRIRLNIRSPALALLPWELVHADGTDLALAKGLAIVRSPERSNDLARITVAPPLRILAVAASPKGIARLDVAAEERTVRSAIEPLVREGKAQLEWRDGLDAAALAGLLDRGGYHVFHFAGHGHFDLQRGKGLLFLTGADGRAALLPADRLGNLLAGAKIKLAFLNSCEGAAGSKRGVFSSMAATLVQMGVPAVLAMTRPVADRAAVTLAGAFYRALAEGRSVEEATLAARIRVNLEYPDTAEWAIPALYTRAQPGPLVGTTASPTSSAALALAPVPSPPAKPDRPYPVLEPYVHRETFKGRDTEIAEALRDLRRMRLLFCLHGASGSGKSSLLEAGLIPDLRSANRPVATTRRPDEPGVAQRLLGQVLALPDDLRVGDEEVLRFAELVETAKRLAGAPPVLVLDQFEDAIRRDEKGEALARIGPLLAATAARSAGDRAPVCQWILSYRQEYHGAVVQWLHDALAGARDRGAVDAKVLAQLPRDLGRGDYVVERAILPFGAPVGGEERREAAQKAFLDAITAPLKAGEDGRLPYPPLHFAEGEAGKLAAAFAEARVQRPRAPLTPELQVVLDHLLRKTGQDGAVRVGEDAAKLITDALADHLDRKLREAFADGPDAASGRRRRTQALLALRELSDENGQRGAGIPEGEIEARVGASTREVLAVLERADIRLVLKERNETSGEQHYVLPHDSLAQVVVRLFADPRAAQERYGLNEELIRLQKEIALRVALGDVNLAEGTFRQIERARDVLVWDGGRLAWWERCVGARRARRRSGGLWRAGVGAMGALLVAGALGAGWWNKNQADTLASNLESASSYAEMAVYYDVLIEAPGQKGRANKLKADFLRKQSLEHEGQGLLDIALVERLEAAEIEGLGPNTREMLEAAHLARSGLHLPEGLQFQVLRHDARSPVRGAAIDGTGKWVVTWTDTAAFVWNVAAGTPPQEIKASGVKDGAVTANGEAVVLHQDNRITLWTSRTPLCEVETGQRAKAGQFMLDRDEQYAAIGVYRDGRERLTTWRMDGCQELGHAGVVPGWPRERAIHFAEKATVVFVGDGNNLVRRDLWKDEITGQTSLPNENIRFITSTKDTVWVVGTLAHHAIEISPEGKLGKPVSQFFDREVDDAWARGDTAFTRRRGDLASSSVGSAVKGIFWRAADGPWFWNHNGRAPTMARVDDRVRMVVPHGDHAAMVITTGLLRPPMVEAARSSQRTSEPSSLQPTDWVDDVPALSLSIHVSPSEVSFYRNDHGSLTLQGRRHTNGIPTGVRTIATDGQSIKLLVKLVILNADSPDKPTEITWLDTVYLDLEAHEPPLPGTAAELLRALSARLALRILPTGEIVPEPPATASSSP